MFINKNSFSSLEELFNMLKDHKLSKEINSFNSSEEIIDHIIREKADIAVNQIIKSIPSDARKRLMKNGCRECDGDGEIECIECEGDGEVECKKCDGNGSLDCQDCNGRGSNECETCNGYSNIECETCNGEGGKKCVCDGGTTKKGLECKRCQGYGTIRCKKCDGNGEIECSKCENGNVECSKCSGEGDFKCEECNGNGNNKCKKCNNGIVKCKCLTEGSDDWNDLTHFFRINWNKKDKLIDFFSKKGGRYSDEYEDIEMDVILDDLKTLISLPTIDEISKISKEDNDDISFVYENDQFLIISSTYEGLQTYGSPYWCIRQSESTFNDYVSSDLYFDSEDFEDYKIPIQLVLFMKNKTPFSDDKSVMGITIKLTDEENGIDACHWEDDDDAFSDIRSFEHIICGISNNSYMKAIINQYDDEEIVDFFKLSTKDGFNNLLEDFINEEEQNYDNLVKILFFSKKFKFSIEKLSNIKIKYDILNLFYRSCGNRFYGLLNSSDDTILNICRTIFDNNLENKFYINPNLVNNYKGLDQELIELNNTNILKWFYKNGLNSSISDSEKIEIGLIDVEEVLNSGNKNTINQIATANFLNNLAFNKSYGSKKVANYILKLIDMNIIIYHLEDILFIFDKEKIKITDKIRKYLLNYLNIAEEKEKSLIAKKILDNIDDDEVEEASARVYIGKKASKWKFMRTFENFIIK